MAEMKFTDTVPLKTRLTDEEVAKIAAMRFRFPGVEVKARPYRNYPLGPTAAHVIGHIGRISHRGQRADRAKPARRPTTPAPRTWASSASS